MLLWLGWYSCGEGLVWCGWCKELKLPLYHGNFEEISLPGMIFHKYIAKLTLRKNKLPAGKKTRCWVTLRGTPSLYQTIVGSGMPSALQFIVTGSLRGTVVSMGCSTIRGTWKAAKRKKRGKKLLAKNVSFRFLPRHVHNLVLNLIKLKVLFSVLQALFPLEHPFIPDSLSHNQIMDFQLRRLPNRQNTKWH